MTGLDRLDSYLYVLAFAIAGTMLAGLAARVALALRRRRLGATPPGPARISPGPIRRSAPIVLALLAAGGVVLPAFEVVFQDASPAGRWAVLAFLLMVGLGLLWSWGRGGLVGLGAMPLEASLPVLPPKDEEAVL